MTDEEVLQWAEKLYVHTTQEVEREILNYSSGADIISAITELADEFSVGTDKITCYYSRQYDDDDGAIFLEVEAPVPMEKIREQVAIKMEARLKEERRREASERAEYERLKQKFEIIVDAVTDSNSGQPR